MPLSWKWITTADPRSLPAVHRSSKVAVVRWPLTYRRSNAGSDGFGSPGHENGCSKRSATRTRARFMVSSLDTLASVASVATLASVDSLARLPRRFRQNFRLAGGVDEHREPINAPQQGALLPSVCFPVLGGERLGEVVFFQNAEACLTGSIRQSSIWIVGRSICPVPTVFWSVTRSRFRSPERRTTSSNVMSNTTGCLVGGGGAY